MAKTQTKSATAIETLLNEKQEIEHWLDRLASATDSTPGAVRERVTKDYQGRLERVVTELQGYRQELVSSLEEQKEEQERLTADESVASDRMAEAELRHAVGEYHEKTWSKLKGEILEELEKIRDTLSGVEKEIATLEEVLSLIDQGPPEVVEEAPATEKARASVEEIADLEDEAGEEIADLEKRTSTQTDAFDEMAFLKSVTEDESQGPSPARASGTHGIPAEDIPDPEAARDEIGASGVAAVPDRQQSPKTGKSKKSLKCGECGAKNLPTEWYCERCGAELAAL